MKILDENTLRLSVRELVEFVLRSGDLDNRHLQAAGPEAMSLGQRAHRLIQESAGDSYEAEVPLFLSVPLKKGELSLQGRADGIVRGEEKGVPFVLIDEIKGQFQDIFALEEPEKVHLYQALCYGYMYGLAEHLSSLRIRITYVQLFEEEGKKKKIKAPDQIRYFVKDYSFEELEKEFMWLISSYEKWVEFVLEHRRLRNASAKNFPFPYEYRPGQKKIVHQVYKSLEKGTPLYVQAPTGIGKTLAMLYPAVMAVGQEKGDKIFYLTAKTVAGQVAQEAMTLFLERGLKFSYARIMAKEKICPLEIPKCNPEECPYAKGHFDRVNGAVYDCITRERAITSEVILKYAEKHQVCPFEFCLDVTYYVDTVICDYNYAFSPRAKLQRYFAEGGSKEYIFLVDEAHNLVDRGREMFSSELVKEEIQEAKKLFPGNKSLQKWIDALDLQLLELKRENQAVQIFNEENFPGAVLITLGRLYEALLRFLDKHRSGKRNEEILTFFFSIRDFLETYEKMGPGYLIYGAFTEQGFYKLKLFCIDPSRRLLEETEGNRCCIFFSATFLPIHYYKKLLSGNTKEEAIYVDSPFDPKKRGLFIGRDCSSKYTRRNRAEYEKIAEYILAMTQAKTGHYLAFFPSHQYLKEVKAILEQRGENLEILAQESNMKEQEREAFLNRFRKPEGEELSPAGEKMPGENSGKTGRSLLGLAVNGGFFSEGIDLKKEALIGVCVVGTGLPQVGPERELMKLYFDENGEQGFDFAYRFPGFNKVLQASGRLIRTPEDEGVILLLDERLLQAQNRTLFPREWADFKPVSLENVRENLDSFWNSPGRKEETVRPE